LVRRVNLPKADEPHDVYQDVIVEVTRLLETDNHKWAEWWLHRFASLGDKKVRKLIKTPAMTFAYNAETWGMAEKIEKVGRDIGMFAPHGPATCVYSLMPTQQPTCSCGTYYLAEKIQTACKLILPGPAAVMRFICDLTDHCTSEGRFLEWRTPTGFSVSNRYNVSNKELVYGVEDGCEVAYTVANGVKRDIRKEKARNSSAANFVHSQDAAHLIRIVNAANVEGISNIATVPMRLPASPHSYSGSIR
jgi:Autographiviridae RNA polymerase